MLKLWRHRGQKLPANSTLPGLVCSAGLMTFGTTSAFAPARVVCANYLTRRAFAGNNDEASSTAFGKDGAFTANHRMRILVLTNLYPPHYLGGYELICYMVVNEL